MPPSIFLMFRFCWAEKFFNVDADIVDFYRDLKQPGGW
ncbi:hypothetical protein SAMN05216317_102140 [Nitrosomonas eutropha]|uniref:Uncharacterized protein n=1 Tax=Nitrosomonas eutropha TaxID=916 RepID=A0ABX5MB64_9PROT|nr:hypothetical protein C8R14_1081 [Nitrosomonas eutropha]SCX29481.1 hypothetical protein SAMN05216379_1562 [Nitrosomonas eutropha]SDW13166.1 hypothetical protein SAMN05216317_102140 [Nitrosomonas eutropha]